jgi:heme-degrading monooxygenase HmoA
MPNPEIIVRVRFKSNLTLEQVSAVAEARASDFEALSGLEQKYYLQDAATGEYGGLYVWRSAEAFAAYRDSELRATIAKAYQARGEPDLEVYRVVKVLREDES